jgi:hypothetical protein
MKSKKPNKIMKPTLEQVVEHFKDAEIVECLFNTDNCDITKNTVEAIYEYGSDYWVDIKNHRGINALIWDEEKGYSKIIKTKTMRKVILEEKKSEVYLSDLNEGSIVGVTTTTSNERLFFQYNSEKGFYLVSNRDYFIDIKDKVYEKSISTYVKENIWISEVFIFDKIKDLFKWMSE